MHLLFVVRRHRSLHMSLAVYTAIFGGYDTYKEPRPGEYTSHLFSDQPVSGRSTWHKVPSSTNPRRAARHIKLSPHEFFSDSHVLWLDGSLELIAAPSLSLLGDADIALCRHSVRRSLYEEAEFCATHRVDDPNLIRAQVARYRAAGYPGTNGLPETGFLLRRMSPAMRAFDEAWLDEVERGSCRDQISFGYVAWKTGIKIVYLDGTATHNAWVRYRPHQRVQQTVVQQTVVPLPKPVVSRRAAVMEARWHQIRAEKERWRRAR